MHRHHVMAAQSIMLSPASALQHAPHSFPPWQTRCRCLLLCWRALFSSHRIFAVRYRVPSVKTLDGRGWRWADGIVSRCMASRSSPTAAVVAAAARQREMLRRAGQGRAARLGRVDMSRSWRVEPWKRKCSAIARFGVCYSIFAPPFRDRWVSWPTLRAGWRVRAAGAAS